MSDVQDNKIERDGDNVERDGKNDNDTSTVREPKSVSFNRDVHVKRFGKPRESRSTSSESPIRKQPFTNLSEEQLIEEANKVIEQAQNITCTADHPPEKFFSLPHRKKLKEPLGRRNSDESNISDKRALGRSTSDVNPKRKRERTSLSTLFRKAQRSKSPEAPVIVKTKPVKVVKRSKSDVSDLKSKPVINTNSKPIRKRSGSESEEFLKSLRNKKAQLSPIIESSPSEDYFKKKSPLGIFQRKLAEKSESKAIKSEDKVNPVEKPPRYKSPDKEPKPPARAKRGKSLEKDKEQSPKITETPKRKVEIKKTLLVDEIDTIRGKDINPVEVKDRIKDSIRKIEENIYGNKDMVHSSQQPPDKPPLTRGHTVDQIVQTIKEDQRSPPPSSHLLASSANNTNQPFSYIKPSLNLDPNLFARNSDPDRAPSPVNKMGDRGVVYAQVVRDFGENGKSNFGKQTTHMTYSPPRDRFPNLSDEDEGLGNEERYKSKYLNKTHKSPDRSNFNTFEAFKITDSPIKPKFREFKLTSFDDFEPTYANEFPIKGDTSHDVVDTAIRGVADGMDNRRNYKTDNDKFDLDFNELSHRREVLESRINARRLDRERSNVDVVDVKYIKDKDPIYEADKRMKATEKYVNETARYFKQTLERDGHKENSISEDYDKYEYDSNKPIFKTEKFINENTDRRDFVESPSRFKSLQKSFPPEPEYEPPSLEFNTEKPVLTADEYTEKKYKTKHYTSSHEVIQSGQKYKKDDWFNKKKGHYSSNPDINQDIDDEYKNAQYDPKNSESYHNSLRRETNRDKYLKENYGIRRHESGDSHDYDKEKISPRRYEIDNRLVDSGIENDFRKESSGEIHKPRIIRLGSDADVRNTNVFLANERRHTDENYPSEQIYANGEYITRFENRQKYPKKEYISRDSDESYERSPSRLDEIINSKPPKNNKKLSGLEKVKQLFSRDSSKKSKKEKETVQQKLRTRVLKSPEHLVDEGYRRYKDPEPSDDERRRDYREYRSSREDIDRYRSSDPRESDPEIKYQKYYRNQDQRRHKEKSYRLVEDRRYESSERDSDHRSPRPSELHGGRRDIRYTRSKTADPLDSPALAERYRDRRRLATPSPTPSPPLRGVPTPPTSSGNWFKSLDRLTRKRNKTSKVINENGANTEDESSSRKPWKQGDKTTNSTKNLRFFGDTDQDSDGKSHSKSRIQPRHTSLRKTTSNSSTGFDEPDRVLSHKSSSLSNLREDSRIYKRNLQNISENQNNSEVESSKGRKIAMKPPINPYDRRSRSQSSSKTLRGSKNDVRNNDSRNDLRRDESPSRVRGSKQDVRDIRHRRRTPANNSGGSSTEGDSSQPSQRSTVYLHAVTVGDIPDPGVLARNRSRDDVSSVNSSNLQVRTTQKSFSIFAPWTPRHYGDSHDVHYAQRQRKKEERPSTLQKKKSYSQTTLNKRAPSSRLSNSSTMLYRKPEKRQEESTLNRNKNKKSHSSDVLNGSDSDRMSRSMSMPKDKKKAGWFSLNKSKKQEINTRVR